MPFNKSFKQDAVITPQTGITDLSQSTGVLIVPTGTTAQRPTNAVAGTLRYNTTEGFMAVLQVQILAVAELEGI
jgi:hypothetical protein